MLLKTNNFSLIKCIEVYHSSDLPTSVGILCAIFATPNDTLCFIVTYVCYMVLLRLQLQIIHAFKFDDRHR